MTAPRWWFCRTCEAANNATACVCEVCESAAPAVPATKVSLRDPLVHRVVVASRVEPRRRASTPLVPDAVDQGVRCTVPTRLQLVSRRDS